MKPRCAILVRVSTIRQETDRQINDLKSIVASKGWDVVAIVEEEGIRGSAKVRPGLKQIIDLAESGAIDKVAVHEVSRVARKNSVAHQFIETLTDLKVSLYWHSQGVEMLLDNGTRNPAASLIFSLMSEIARNESDQLSQRIRSGLVEAKRKGRILGRRATTQDDFLSSQQCVVDALNAGMSIRDAAKHCNRSPKTVQKVKKAISHV